MHVALLRGINVGGKNKLSMRELAAIFADAGCTGVRTYIQTGNVVFTAPGKSAKRVPDLVTARIAERFGLRVPVVVRTAGEMHQVVARNPFRKAGAEVATLHVAFLADVPDRRCIATLDPQRSPGDSFRVRGREIYLHLPNGMARTKFTNDYFDRTLATTSTMRNWRTVLKLQEMAVSRW